MAEMSLTPTFRLAPQQLWQAINPWNWTFEGSQVGFINVNIGRTSYPETERAILDGVGSYGVQLGHIGDALEVLIARLDPDSLSDRERNVLAILQGDIANIREIKARERAKAQ